MGTTTGDSLRYPELGEPANVPQDMQELATDVQTALNKRMNVAYSVGELGSLSAGWAHWGGEFGNARFYKSGKSVTALGLLKRTAALTIVDNTLYDLGDVPASYRPLFTLNAAAPWVGTQSGAGRNYSIGQLRIASSGAVQFRPNFSGTLAVDDWVSFAGISWVTA